MCDATDTYTSRNSEIEEVSTKIKKIYREMGGEVEIDDPGRTLLCIHCTP
jgi:hypothetical protein